MRKAKKNRKDRKDRRRVVRAVPQQAEVVARNEYLVRLLQSRAVEVKIFATSPDIAQELAANGLGVITEDALQLSATRSVSQIG